MRPLILILSAFVLSTAACGTASIEEPPTADAGPRDRPDAGDIDEECLGDDGCYACPPETPLQVLNACSDSDCSPFDNVKRLPLLEGGQLPPLP